MTAHAIEPSNEFQYFYRWYGIKKIANTFEETSEIPAYVMLLASHWLEHVVDLNETCQKLSRLLRPGGFLFLEVPNCDDEYWRYRFSPNPVHLHFFTTASLRELLEKFGFRVDFLMTVGPPVEWERSVGYLKPDTPALLSREELKQLEQERNLRQGLLLENLDPETRTAAQTHSFFGTYSDEGRQYIQVVATVAS